jgi:hypothetical protein
MYVLGSCFFWVHAFTILLYLLYWAITAIMCRITINQAHPQNEAMNHPRLSFSTRNGSDLSTGGAAWKFHLLIWWCSDGKCTFRSSTCHPHSWRCLVQCGESLSLLIAPAAAIWLLSRAISRQRQLLSIAIRRCCCFHQSPTPQKDGETLIFNASNCIDLDDEIPDGPQLIDRINITARDLTICIWLPTSPRFTTRSTAMQTYNNKHACNLAG